MARLDWTTLKGHTGLSYREYEAGQRYYRFRQKPYKDDMLGVMPESQASLVAATLRDNRRTGVGPQSWHEMEEHKVSQVQARELASQAEAITRKHEQEKIIATERFAQANTVASFWDNVYWPERSKKGSTHNNDSLTGLFNRWIRPHIGDIPLQKLKFTDVKNVMEFMADDGRSAKTIRHMYTTLQAEWNYAQIYLSAHNNIILPIFPGKLVQLPKLNNEKTCWLERDEASLLLKTLYDWRQTLTRHGIKCKGPDTKDAYGMAVLSLLSGLRLGDICNLTWQDVDTAFALARNPKGGKAYGIHLDVPMIQDMLEERRSMFPHVAPHEYVFRDSRGRQWKEAPKAYQDAVDELGFNFTPRRRNNPMEHIDFHALRHTFASWLSHNGTDLHTIMVLMGHENITMTLRYARLNPAYTKRPVEDLAADFLEKHGSGIVHDTDGHAYIPAQPVNTEFDSGIFTLQ